MRKVLIVLGTFVLGGLASAALWTGWSARCGDDCPTSSIVHMLVFLALLPTFSTMGAALLVSTGWPVRVKQGIALALLLVAVVVGAVVSRV